MGGGGMDSGSAGSSGKAPSMDDMISEIMGRKRSISAGSIPQNLQDEIMDQIIRHQRKRHMRHTRNTTTKDSADATQGSTDNAKQHKDASPSPNSYPGFLEQANVAHFSMCFNEGKDGWLGLSKTVPADHQSNCLPSLGKAHWGVGLFGISVASKSSLLETPVKDVCTKKEAGQDSPCGAIIDSGTTVVTGPQDQVNSLLENICDAWPRCSKDYAALN